MRKSPAAAFILALALSCQAIFAAAEARAPSWKKKAPLKDALIRQIAEADAWSELCVNYSTDPDAVARFRRRQHIAVDGHYRVVYGFAYARNHVEAMRMHGGNIVQSCFRALDRFGGEGAKIPNLVRPLWHGAVPNQMIDTNGPGFDFFPTPTPYFTGVK